MVKIIHSMVITHVFTGSDRADAMARMKEHMKEDKALQKSFFTDESGHIRVKGTLLMQDEQGRLIPIDNG